MNTTNAKKYFSDRKFKTGRFLELIEESYLIELQNNFKNIKIDNDSNPTAIESKYIIEPKHFSFLDESMIDYIISKGIDYIPPFENHKIDLMKSNSLKRKVYMSQLLNVLIDIFAGKDSEKLSLNLLSDVETSFDDRYFEFIENYLSCDNKYIDYLGCILIFSEALKSDGLFNFLSKHMRLRLLSLVSDTAVDVYTKFIEERLFESLEKAISLETQADKLQIELNKKDRALSKLKKKATEKFESDKLIERKNIDKELRNKDASIKKLTEQLSSEASDSPIYLSPYISELKEAVRTSISEELFDVRTRLESLDNSISDKLLSIESSAEILSGIYKNIPMSCDSEKLIESVPSEFDSSETYFEDDVDSEDDIEFNMNTLENYLPAVEASQPEPDGIQSIGYVEIEYGTHYVYYPDGGKYKLENIPEGIYISDGQFVLTRNMSEFKYVFRYNNNTDSGFISAIDSFATVCESNGEYRIDKGDGPREILSVKSSVTLRDGQIVAVTGDNTFFKYYKPNLPSLDIFENSIKAKRHRAYFITKLSEGIAEGTEVFEGREGYPININSNKTNHEIQVHNTVILNEDDKICGVFPHIKFYTNSSFYNGAFHSIAVVSDGKVFIEDNEELIPVNEVPETLEISDGQVLLLDEFNNLLKALNSSSTESSKSKQSKKTSISSDRGVVLPLQNSALVIGNLSYSDSYRQSFAKKGYQAIVIDGYESWTRIEKASRSAEKIFVISNHVSHDNMHTIKRRLKNRGLLFPKEDGANRLAEYL